MALFIFIIFHLLLEVKSQANLSSVSTSNTTTSLVVTSSTEIITDSITNMSSLSTHDSHSLTDPANASLESTMLTDTTEHASGLPQARLTIFPTFATDEEKVHMVCGGHENQHISECMFYAAGQEHLFKPSASCNFSLTGADLITWSQDQESSHVNISCYYTVQGKNGTSPHSDIVSVRVRGLATMSSLPRITEGSPTTMTPNGTSQANLSSVSTSNTTTYMSSLSTHDSHSLTDPANASMESTMLTDTTEHASVFPLMTEGPEIKKYSNTKMFFFIAVVASGGGIVLTGLVGICLYGCTRKSKAERIWIEFNRKKLGQSLPTASSETTGEEDAVLYSTLKFMQSPSQPPGNSEESRQTEVEPNHLYCTILTKPAISSDSRSVYSQLKIR